MYIYMYPKTLCLVGPAATTENAFQTICIQRVITYISPGEQNDTQWVCVCLYVRLAGHLDVEDSRSEDECENLYAYMPGRSVGAVCV